MKLCHPSLVSVSRKVLTHPLPGTWNLCLLAQSEAMFSTTVRQHLRPNVPMAMCACICIQLPPLIPHIVVCDWQAFCHPAVQSNSSNSSVASADCFLHTRAASSTPLYRIFCRCQTIALGIVGAMCSIITTAGRDSCCQSGRSPQNPTSHSSTRGPSGGPAAAAAALALTATAGLVED